MEAFGGADSFCFTDLLVGPPLWSNGASEL